MLSVPFLTDLDERAQVKGSVDPLGAMPIWSRIGRRVVGNLTTATSSVRDFKTLVLGFALLEDVRRARGDDAEVDDLAAFLRWEQLAAYTRASMARDFDFRGMRRVRERVGEGPVVPISAERDCQILGNQKIYGLWGLYTVAGRASKLLEKERNELTAEAEAFVAKTWRGPLSPSWSFLVSAIAEDNRRFRLDRHEAHLKRLKTVWMNDAPEGLHHRRARRES